jgi:hypothetical protein
LGLSAPVLGRQRAEHWSDRFDQLDVVLDELKRKEEGNGGE